MVGREYRNAAENRITLPAVRRSVKTDMLEAGVNNACRDLIRGHSLEGMDRHCIKPPGHDPIEKIYQSPIFAM